MLSVSPPYLSLEDYGKLELIHGQSENYLDPSIVVSPETTESMLFLMLFTSIASPKSLVRWYSSFIALFVRPEMRCSTLDNATPYEFHLFCYATSLTVTSIRPLLNPDDKTSSYDNDRTFIVLLFTSHVLRSLTPYPSIDDALCCSRSINALNYYVVLQHVILRKCCRL